MLLYIIFTFGHEGITPTKVALLLLMPLTIKLVLGEVMLEVMAIGFKMILSMIIAEGEMIALTWVEPLLVQLILVGTAPPKEPPEVRQYFTKATREKKQGRWTDLWKGVRAMLSPPRAATRLGNRGMSRNEARTKTRSPERNARRGPATTRKWPRA
jgi:hypothetical protein